VGLNVIAVLRADSVNLPLFLHILGAMMIVGALVLAASFLFGAWRGDSPQSLRYGFRSLLYGAIPGYLVMRIAAEWLYSEEELDKLDSDPSWIGIGYGVADIGLLVLIVGTVAAGIAARRGERPGTTGARISASLVGLLLVMYVVAVWAMTTKPV
jgi:hypothetical protein